MAVPILIRTEPTQAKAGEVVTARIVVIHPNESGSESEDANYIENLQVYYNDQLVGSGTFKGGVSANPLYAVKLLAREAGTIKVVYEDTTGATGEKTASLSVQ